MTDKKLEVQIGSWTTGGEDLDSVGQVLQAYILDPLDQRKHAIEYGIEQDEGTLYITTQVGYTTDNGIEQSIRQTCSGPMSDGVRAFFFSLRSHLREHGSEIKMDAPLDLIEELKGLFQEYESIADPFFAPELYE
jgi:hypothetical protein